MHKFNDSVFRRAGYKFDVTEKKSPRAEVVTVKLKAVERKCGNMSAKALLNKKVFRWKRKKKKQVTLVEMTDI